VKPRSSSPVCFAAHKLELSSGVSCPGFKVPHRPPGPWSLPSREALQHSSDPQLQLPGTCSGQLLCDFEYFFGRVVAFVLVSESDGWRAVCGALQPSAVSPSCSEQRREHPSPRRAAWAYKHAVVEAHSLKKPTNQNPRTSQITFPAQKIARLQRHRITESQNSRGWQGPLWVTQSNPPAEAGSPTAGCTGPCPGGA